MYHIKVLDAINDRLDAEYYNPAALQTIKKMRSQGELSTLGSLIIEGYRVVYHGIDSVNNLTIDQTVPFLSPTQIDKHGAIDFDCIEYLPQYYKTKYPKGLAKAGELLVEVKGSVSKVSIVPAEYPENLMISGSLYKAMLDNRKADSHYILAFLKSAHGQILKNRLTSNTIINYIAKDALYSIPVLLVENKAQNYIGGKVRQAEQLRAWARKIESAVNHFHQQLIPEQETLNFKKNTRKVSTMRMTERLDVHFYPGVVEEYLKRHRGKFSTLRSLTNSLYNGQTQAETTDRNSCQQITVTNLSPLFVSGQPRTVVKPSKKDKFLNQHDLLICNAAHNKSYIGRDITYVHSEKALLPSTEVMIIRVNRSKVPASYVRSYLKSQLGFVQIQSTIRGITAHSYPNDMAILDIFVPEVSDDRRDEWMAQDDLMAKAGQAVELASLLTATAKQLVEALIEGQVTEQQLIDAQQALEADDNDLDQAILSKLTTKGFKSDHVIDSKPLFDDLDELYRLLKETQEAEDE